ncbi:MAG: hypothetical protein ACU0BB_06935 [Paracoccaceae bacterium]
MIIKRLPAAVLVLTPVVTFASDDLDANQDGVYNIAEMQAAYPELTAEAFSAMDTNSDGLLDAAELEIAKANGAIPAADG